MKKQRNLKIGSDPELFILEKGKIISVEGLLGGTKSEPFSKGNWGKGYAVQEDNVLAEYNIPAVDKPDDFVNAHLLMFNRIESVIKENTGKQVKVVVKASHNFKEEELTSEQALLFGCDPDMNIWTEEFNEAPDAMQTLRTAGGHIHLGWDNPTLQEQINVTKFMDLYLGIKSVLLDEDDKRKEMYGKAGAMRFKEYGIEYRVLSNFWLKDHDSIKWAFEESVKAFEDAMSRRFPEELKNIQHIIDNNDKKSASKIANTLD